MLDDLNVINQKDPKNALGVAASEVEQLSYSAEIESPPKEKIEIENIIVAGMGGSALAAGIAKKWLDLKLPFEVIKDYTLPGYISSKTLVIVSSYSGNTEETLEAFDKASKAGANVAIIAAGGKLIAAAREDNLPFVQLPEGVQPRMAVTYNLRGLIRLLEFYGIIHGKYDEISGVREWLQDEVQNWLPLVKEKDNLAKQLAMKAVGKTLVIYAGGAMAPVAYKWKISFNENAKNVAFWNQLPEFNHNEFIGWTSHPVEKPFAVFDLLSSFEHPRTRQRFEVSDRLLSGQRPKSIPIELRGDSVIKQMLWGSILADFVSIYVAILNGVDPTPVDLIEKLKDELK